MNKFPSDFCNFLKIELINYNFLVLALQSKVLAPRPQLQPNLPIVVAKEPVALVPAQTAPLNAALAIKRTNPAVAHIPVHTAPTDATQEKDR